MTRSVQVQVEFHRAVILKRTEPRLPFEVAVILSEDAEVAWEAPRCHRKCLPERIFVALSCLRGEKCVLGLDAAVGSAPR